MYASSEACFKPLAQAAAACHRQELTYTVNNSARKGEKLALLRDVSGFFLPGQMSALVRSPVAKILTRAPNSVLGDQRMTYARHHPTLSTTILVLSCVHPIDPVMHV